MSFERLYAKSRPKDGATPDSIYLPNHLRDVHDAAAQVLDSTACDQLLAFGLQPESWETRFRRIVRLAAALHDLGKANDHFQNMLKSKERQGLRHEWVTLLMAQEYLRNWLLPAVEMNEIDWQIVLWVVSGHHPAYNRPSPPRLFVDGAGSEMQLLMGRDDFATCLKFIAEQFALGAPPPCSDQPLPLVGRENAFARIFHWYQEAKHVWDPIAEKDRDEKRFVAAAKYCLVAADVAGSALPKEVKDKKRRSTWIKDAFAQRPTRGRIEKIVNLRLGKDSLRPFQKQVAESTASVTLARAGCGSGKTLAGFHWAATRHPTKRLYFCYPTTGTATEGYRDYLHNPEEDFDTDLFHGRAAVDLEIILNTRVDDERPDADAVARIESLDTWSTPIVSCTVDTVLGVIQTNRRGLYAWPALAGAAFIFDEIHAYDDKLFGALLRFLQALRGVPVLLMTASLPAARTKALEQCLARVNRQLLEIPGPPDLEQRPRYHLHGKVEARDPLPDIRKHMKEMGNNAKVLWVCNTVSRVMKAAEQADDLHPLIYHSRFRYENRVKQHQKLIEAFKSSGPTLAVASQVAEMSLDLSSTLLVFDLCPVPSAIQRLGRLNRRANDGDPTCPFIVVNPVDDDGKPSVLPYTPEDFEVTKRWLDALPKANITQQDLATAWENLTEIKDRRPAYVPSAWLDGGPVTQVLELREASPGITVIMERDVQAIRDDPKLLQRCALPMPPPPKHLREMLKERDMKGIPVAPNGTIDYHPERGAQWQK